MIIFYVLTCVINVLILLSGRKCEVISQKEKLHELRTKIMLFCENINSSLY